MVTGARLALRPNPLALTTPPTGARVGAVLVLLRAGPRPGAVVPGRRHPRLRVDGGESACPGGRVARREPPIPPSPSATTHPPQVSPLLLAAAPGADRACPPPPAMPGARRGRNLAADR